MKTFNNSFKNTSYTLYRLIRPVFDPLHCFGGIKNYPKFISDFMSYKKNSQETIALKDIFPVLGEATSETSFDAHYYYQLIWAYKHILARKPKHHIDIASSYQLSGLVSLITSSTFVDIRPVPVNLPNLKVLKGNITNLPFRDNSVISLSSLHVIEHIGLGRYGDEIDSGGTMKACSELARVLEPGGRLYLSTPIGLPRVCFHAHRIHTPKQILSFFPQLSLKLFSAIDDAQAFHEKADISLYERANYACGLFVFEKK